MRTQYTVAMSLLASVALDGLAVQGLHAQAKLKAYSIGEIVPIAVRQSRPATSMPPGRRQPMPMVTPWAP